MSTGGDVKPISAVRLNQIFDGIGLSREQIAAITTGATRPPQTPRVITVQPLNRPRCPVCGQQISAFNCKPFRQLWIAQKLKD